MERVRKIFSLICLSYSTMGFSSPSSKALGAEKMAVDEVDI